MYHFFYVAESQFDKEDAVNNRIINNIKAITSKNNCIVVTIIGYGEEKESIKDGITIKNVRKGKNLVTKLFYFIFRGFYVYKLLSKEPIQPDLIIYYGSTFRFFYPIMKYVRRKKIKIVCDVVEWYDPSHLALGRFGPVALDVFLGFKYFIPKCDGVIAISAFLENYFISKNLKTIKVPVLVETKTSNETEVKIESFDKNCLNIIYAGFPGKKDIILNIIEAIRVLHREGIKILFHILGPTIADLQVKSQPQFSTVIKCYGRVDQKIVAQFLKQANYSVLLRPNERYAQAGFPTKFVESMNAGLPVIANLTSDLAYYLKDGYNGFIVKDYSVKSLLEVLRKIIVMDKDNLKIMRKNALLTARKNFDYRLFSDDFSKFFFQILNH